MEVELLVHNDTQLGEGPVWDHRQNTLFWVDILKGHLQAYDYRAGTNKVFPMGEFTGTVVPTTGGKLLVALKNRIATFELNSKQLRTFCVPEQGRELHRFNDGKCDSKGRFWIGSTEIEHQNPTGILYCVFSDGFHKPVLQDVHISYGLAWSPDQSTLYFIDSPTKAVSAFDFNLESAELSNRREVLNLDQETGVPDGMCIDSAGHLWIAFYGGGQVACFDPDSGKCLRQIKVPARNTTSCCFGGKDMDELFITTAKRDDPQGGGLYRCRPGSTGPQADLFRL